jgi:DNA replication protein DnaC
MSLAQNQWVTRHHNILITGPTGAGKSYLTCALAQKACRDGHTALYHRLPKLLQELALARLDGRYPKVMSALVKGTSKGTLLVMLLIVAIAAIVICINN